MLRRRVLNVLAFLRDNVRQGIETLKDAREFARRASGLAEDERLFLSVALSNRHRLESFYRAFLLGLRPGRDRNRSRAITGASNRSGNPSRGDQPDAQYP